MIDIAAVRSLLTLDGLLDPQIEPHLNRAYLDIEGTLFTSNTQELEVVGWKTIYYLSPQLWLSTQRRVNEMDESLDTFKDLETFQSYCLNRSNEAMPSDTTGNEELAWDAS